MAGHVLRLQRERPAQTAMYSGTSLIRSPMGLPKSDINGEVTVLQGLNCTVEYNFGLIMGDPNGEGRKEGRKENLYLAKYTY